ncbi:MAG: hypothetical protein QM759_05240 [Terricaulis sp.]
MIVRVVVIASAIRAAGRSAVIVWRGGAFSGTVRRAVIIRRFVLGGIVVARTCRVVVVRRRCFVIVSAVTIRGFGRCLVVVDMICIDVICGIAIVNFGRVVIVARPSSKRS